MNSTEEQTKKRRGRPKGRKNKPKKTRAYWEYGEVLNTAEAAELIRMSEGLVRELFHQGVIKGFYSGPNIRIPKFPLAVQFGIIPPGMEEVFMSMQTKLAGKKEAHGGG